MTLYVAVLFTHSYLRWGVLALALLVLARAAVGSLRQRDWSRADDLCQVALLKAAYVQCLLGLCMYFFLSPYSAAFFADMRAGMREPALRFFGIEHVFAMFGTVGILHAGRKATQRAEAAPQRRRRAGLTTLVALLVICAAIPWPRLRYGRPLLRMAAGASWSAPR